MSNVYLSEVNKINEEQIGYLEKKTPEHLYEKTANAGNNNYTKFAKDIWDKVRKLLNGNKQGKAYCALYQLWLIGMASNWDIDKIRKVMCLDGSIDKGGAAAGAENLRQYFVYKKRYDKNPKVGDIIFFDTDSDKKAEHVGRVDKVTTSMVYTSEGNTTKDGKGGVWNKSYNKSNKKILGYGHPKYDAEVVDVKLDVLSKGMNNEQVATLQRLLKELGYYTMKVDKNFGPGTETATKAFQKAKGLPQTGVVDDVTWNKILKG